MKKVVRLGMVKLGGSKVRASVFCKIEYSEKGRLSISGVEGPLQSGNCRGGCGQINMHLKASQIEPGEGWTVGKVAKFLKVWDRWHLNDMQAGCIHQESERRETGKKFVSYQASENDPPVDVCPVCGYAHGSEWKFQAVPGEVIEFLESLPEADKAPAWV